MGNEKLKFLDGIRGLMAINVILCHFVIVYFPQMYGPGHDGWGAIIGRTPLNVLVNGDIGVRFFIVLTGFLVGKSFFSPRGGTCDKETVLIKSVNRYFRLLPVIFFGTLFTWLTMVFGLQRHLQIVNLVANGYKLEITCNFEPTIARFLLNALYEPFVLEGSDFLSPLWMIRFELWGYILSMITCYFLRDSRLRRIGYVVVALLLWVVVDENYIGFFMGLFVADIHYCIDENTTVCSRYYGFLLRKKAVIILLACLGIYLAVCPMEFVGIHAPLSVIPKVTTFTPRAAGVALCLFCLMQVPAVWSVFEGKWLLSLGKISFSLYVFHWPIMLTLEAWLFELFYGKMSYNSAAILAFILSLPAMILVACGSHFLIERKCKIDVSSLFKKLSAV